MGESCRVARSEISDEAWVVIDPLFPMPDATGRPPVERRAEVEATAWRYGTGAPWRAVPERFGNWHALGILGSARLRRDGRRGGESRP
ncbi:transposase [Sphaerisporangium sp. NPDC051011]|uniref:transposase n=1 Tax=Sphaerisporangium sp. NPDC051011 TaxID=3155792 RepID=UPI003400C732